MSWGRPSGDRTRLHSLIDILPAMNDRDSYRATHAAPWWVLASKAAAGTSPPLMPPPRAFRVSASPAATMRPSTRMFLAAFRSRSWVMPHCGQVQDLTARGFFPELTPHPEQSWLDGNQRLTLTTVRWQRSAFSSHNRTSVDQLASATDFASRVGPDRTRPGPPHRSLGYRRRCGGPACDVRPCGYPGPCDAG